MPTCATAYSVQHLKIGGHYCLVHCRFQTLTPKIAATALHALDALVTDAVQCRKTLALDWPLLYEVTPSACLCLCQG